MNKEQAIAVIAEKQKQADRLLEEIRELADRHNIEISRIDLESANYWDSSQVCW